MWSSTDPDYIFMAPEWGSFALEWASKFPAGWILHSARMASMAEMLKYFNAN
jgi:hypothetical protein